jgi:ADP-ribose pyrophosphatase YjhB (NUDIX family)
MLNKTYQLLFVLLYRLKLFYNWLFRPTAHGVYIAVWWNNSILLIRNSYKNVLTFPCGGIHKKEINTQAALRELEEEVNLKIKANELRLHSNVTSYYEFMTDKITIFEVKLNEQPDIKIDQREVIWSSFLTLESALQRPLFPVVKDYLLQKQFSQDEKK